MSSGYGSDFSSVCSSPEAFVHVLPDELEWSCDPTFGIVHPIGCNVCRDYMSHFMTSSLYNDASFHRSIKERDSKATVRFLDGVREGRCLQEKQDRERLKRYRTQRNDAVERNIHYEMELCELEEELKQTIDKLVSLQLAHDEMVFLSSSGGFSTADSGAVAMQSMLMGSVSETDDNSSRSLIASDVQTVAFSEEDHNSNMTTYNNNTPPSIYLPSTNIICPFDSCYDDSDASSVEVDETDDSDTESSLSAGSQSPSSSPASFEVCDLPLALLPAPPEMAVTAIDRLKLLMAAAHKPGNTIELLEVRKLCSRAHLTSRNLRSEAQKYLLENWRSPRASAESIPQQVESIQTGAAAVTRTAVDYLKPSSPSQIFVDASHSGIGFVMDDKWLAWELKKEWKGEGRDISWGEMVAVELGLRTIIAAGYRSTRLVVRSDNSGVVVALHTKSCRHRQQSAILKEILSLCATFDIRIVPIWISTKDNPADGPSRGVFPPRSLLFSDSPVVPSHLVEYLSQV